MAKILYINLDETGIWNDYYQQISSGAPRPEMGVTVTHLGLGDQ